MLQHLVMARETHTSNHQKIKIEKVNDCFLTITNLPCLTFLWSYSNRGHSENFWRELFSSNIIFEYDGYPRINKCLGNLNLTKITWYSMCEFNKPLEKTSVEYAIYIFKWSICTGQVVLMLSITLNLFDMFFYHRIFSYMKR